MARFVEQHFELNSIVLLLCNSFFIRPAGVDRAAPEAAHWTIQVLDFQTQSHGSLRYFPLSCKLCTIILFMGKDANSKD